MEKDEVESPVAFTARYVCGLRCVEGRLKAPLLFDPLATFLCGTKGLSLAEEELRNLQVAQGEGKHLRVPARNRLMDDEVMWAVSDLGKCGYSHVQVICLGCGLDSRPWRLSPPSNMEVSWLDVDMDELIKLKTELLTQSGAQTAASECQDCKFPLTVSRYNTVGMDLSKNIHENLGPALKSAGFDPSLPCVWCLEAVIYYLELKPACSLLEAMANLSRGEGVPARLVATCIDDELLKASQSMPAGSHVFANLWFFDVDELLAHPSYCNLWKTVHQPQTSKALSKERYNAETYVALYGGAECVFAAEIISPGTS